MSSSWTISVWAGVFSAWVLGYALFQAPSGRLAGPLWAEKNPGAGNGVVGGVQRTYGARPGKSRGFTCDPLDCAVPAWASANRLTIRHNRLVAAWVPSQERGLANGLIFAGVGLGAAVTPPLIAYIIYHYGWRSSLWACAFIGLVVGALWFLIARDEPDHHPWVTPQEHSYISAGLPHTTKNTNSQALPWPTILGSKNVWIVTASYFGFVYVAYIFFTWFFTYLNTVRGLDLKASAGYAMLPFAAMAACSSLGGLISDRLTRRYGKRVGRCLSAGGSMVVAAIFVGLGTQVGDARLASVVLAGGAGALYLAQSAFWSVSSDIGGRSAGSVSGVMNMGGQLGGATTASLTPFVAKHFGWDMSFWVAAGLCFLGALAWLMVDPDQELTAAPKH